MPRHTPALLRAMDILDLFLTRSDGLTAPEIVETTGLPRASVHELLATLTHGRLLQRDDHGRYRLGLKLMQYGNAVRDSLDLSAVGQRIATQVAARCQETVNVGIRDRGDIIYIAKVESTAAVRLVSAVGRRLPLNCTALGKAVLANLPAAEQDAFFAASVGDDGLLPALTRASVTDPAALLNEIEEIAESGVAWEQGESTPEVNCVAAPAFDDHGILAAAMSISVPQMRWSLRDAQSWAELVRRGAADLTRAIGG